jgi:hypothetical protein
MTRVRLSVLWVLVMASAGSAQAQATEGGWQVSVDFLSIVTRGNDVHVGDVYTEHQTVSGTATNARLDYGVNYEPILTEMKTDQTGMISAGYRGPSWGFGARAWRVETEAAVEGQASSQAPTATSNSITGVRLWDNSVIPVNNATHPSGLSPVTFHAENALEHLRIEAYVERVWVSGPGLNVATRFGLARAHIENTRSEGQTQRAFLQEAGPGTLSTLTNNVTLNSESEATMNLTGPMVAVAGDSTFGRVRIDWLVDQSILLGTAETSGTWTDVDDITEVIVTGSTRLETTTFLNGAVPTSNEERAAVPVLDLQIKASFLVTKNFSVGGGVFSSTLFGLPVAPAFSIPGEWTDVAGTGWRQQTRDITFGGFTLSAGFAF